MALLSYDTDDKADERLNPAEQARFDQIQAGNAESELSDREKAAINDLESQFDDTDSDAGRRVDDASESLNNKESSIPNKNGFYQPSNKSNKKQPMTFKSLMKKRGPIIAIAGAIGVGGGLMGAFFGPATMLQNIVENMRDTNDSASTVKEHRFRKHFNRILNSGDNTGICQGKKGMRCKLGRISNKALWRLSKQGIKPVNADGSEINLKKTGYPDKNPSHYSVEGINNGKPIKASELKDELIKPENRKIGNKVYGRIMRFYAWTGKHMQRVYKHLNLTRNGGIANKIDKKLGVQERVTKFKEKLPKFDGGKASGAVNDRIKGLGEKIGKGGLVYGIAAGGCVVAKVPNIVTAGVAAIQLAPVLTLVMEVILSPGSQAKAAGFGSGFTPEAMDTIGTMLTERGKMKDSENTEGSALDSPTMMATMGINQNKPAIAKNYVPGYSVISNPIIQSLNGVKEATDPVCNFILSPYTMYSFSAMELSATWMTGGVGLLARTVGKVVVQNAITSVAGWVAGEAVKNLLLELATKFLAPNTAQYKDLGDSLGVGAAAFFSTGSMSQMLPGLKRSQLAEFNGIKIANEKIQKEMDIASLSPFDTSSKYTFLGSIVHNMGNMMLANGTYSRTPMAMLSNIFRLPSMALTYSSTAKAANGMYSDKYCGYAKDFNMGSGSPDDPAINLAGLPCTGITKDQANMSTDEALQIAEEEGWVDNSKEIPDGATIEDLIKIGYVVENTPLHDFISDCSDASTGEYWFKSGGCTAPSSSTSSGPIKQQNLTDPTDGSAITGESAGTGSDNKTYSDRKLSAMSVLLIDFQVAQSINGEDEEENEGGSNEAKPVDDSDAVGEPQLAEAANGWGGHENGKIPDSELQSLSFSPSDKMHKKAAKAMEEMNKAYKAETGTDLTINEAYRDCDTQIAYATPGNPRYQGGAAKPAPPCGSNHGWGLAVDINVGGTGSNVYKWLEANAHKYGYVHPAWAKPGGEKPEPWHWEYARNV
jgi:hypothetical protein